MLSPGFNLSLINFSPIPSIPTTHTPATCRPTLFTREPPGAIGLQPGIKRSSFTQYCQQKSQIALDQSRSLALSVPLTTRIHEMENNEQPDLKYEPLTTSSWGLGKSSSNTHMNWETRKEIFPTAKVCCYKKIKWSLGRQILQWSTQHVIYGNSVCT